jgi:hypothetical protein
MKKTKTFNGAFLFSVIITFLMVTTGAYGQKGNKPSPAMDDNISKILTNSCTPCHTSKGGMMSQARFNLTNWTQYSPEKQKEKADNIYSVLEKSKMPPKSARESRPETIPTKEQIELIKKWADSLKTDNKK